MRHAGHCPGCGGTDLAVDTLAHTLTVTCVAEHCINRLHVEVEGVVRIPLPSQMGADFEPVVTLTLWGRPTHERGGMCLMGCRAGMTFHAPPNAAELRDALMAAAVSVSRAQVISEDLRRMRDDLDRPDAVQRITGEGL